MGKRGGGGNETLDCLGLASPSSQLELSTRQLGSARDSTLQLPVASRIPLGMGRAASSQFLLSGAPRKQEGTLLAEQGLGEL